MAAAIAAADDAAAAMVASGDVAQDPADFEATFEEDGPIGIVWSGTLDGVELGQSWLTAAIPIDYPYCSCTLTRVR